MCPKHQDDNVALPCRRSVIYPPCRQVLADDLTLLGTTRTKRVYEFVDDSDDKSSESIQKDVPWTKKSLGITPQMTREFTTYVMKARVRCLEHSAVVSPLHPNVTGCKAPEPDVTRNIVMHLNTRARALLPDKRVKLRVLVRCPGAGVANWASEFNKFLLSVVRYADHLTDLGKIIVPG